MLSVAWQSYGTPNERGGQNKPHPRCLCSIRSYDDVMCQRITVAHWVTQKLVCTIQEELMLSQGPSLNSKRQQTRETAQGRKT